jgi:anti-sigma-K factor RskA
VSEDSHIDPQLCGDSAAPYVLGALTEDEHEVFRRHLDSCAVCREEVAALQVVASALPAAAPQLSAPPALKRRVMASVHEDVRREEARRAGEAREPGEVGEVARSSRRPSRAHPRWRPMLASAAFAAAAVVAVIAVIAASSGDGGGTRVIRAEVIPPGASASLLVSGGHAQLDISGMPRTSAERVYEVWIKRSGGPQPTDALFTVTARGDATVGVPGSVDGVKVVMVTSEPLGGSRVPTTSPVIVAHLS